MRLAGLQDGPTGRSPSSCIKFTQVRAVIPPPSPQPSRATLAVLVASFLFVLLGSLMHVLQDGSFLYRYAPQYSRYGWIAFYCLVPALSVWLLSQKSFTDAIQRRYPTPWIRWMVMYPATITLLAGMIVIAPRGWLVAHAWAFGADSRPPHTTGTPIPQYQRQRPRRRRIESSQFGM